MSDGKEDKRDSRDKYNSLKKDNNKLLEDELRQRWEKDAINIPREVGEKWMTRLTDCHILGHIVLPDHVFNLHSQPLLEAPQNVKQKEKDENGCLVTGCTKRCHSHLTSHGIPDNHLKLSTSEYHRHDLVTCTLDEDNGKGEIRLTSNGTLEHLMEKVQKSLFRHNEKMGVNPVRYETESIKALDQLVTAIRDMLYNAVMDVKDESALAVSIIESIEVLACNNDQVYIAGVEECMNEIKQYVIKARKNDEGRNQMLADMDEFMQVVIKLITSSRRNSRKKEFFELNRYVVGSSTGLKCFNLNYKLAKLANLASTTEPFASGEVDSTGGEVVSVAGIKDESHLRSMLLKKLRMVPQQLFESRDSNGAYTVYSERGGGRGGGRRVKLKKVTKEIRARMKSRAEKEREGWTTTGSSDDDENYTDMG